MTTKTAGAAGRSAAPRKATDAMARRAEQFARREKDLLALTSEFHTAAERAEKVRADAETKAARLLQDAETKAAALRTKAEADAAGFDELAAAAVRKMLAFGEDRGSVSDLTGWPPVRVSQAQRALDTARTKPSSGAIR